MYIGCISREWLSSFTYIVIVNISFEKRGGPTSFRDYISFEKKNWQKTSILLRKVKWKGIELLRVKKEDDWWKSSIKYVKYICMNDMYYSGCP
jgi:hypothetical protein